MKTYKLLLFSIIILLNIFKLFSSANTTFRILFPTPNYGGISKVLAEGLAAAAGGFHIYLTEELTTRVRHCYGFCGWLQGSRFYPSKTSQP